MRVTTTAILALTTSFCFAKKQEDVVSRHRRHYIRQNPADSRSLQEELLLFADDGSKKAKKERQANHLLKKETRVKKHQKSQGPAAVAGLFTGSHEAVVDGGENTDLTADSPNEERLLHFSKQIPLVNGEKAKYVQGLEGMNSNHEKHNVAISGFTAEEHDAPDIGILRVESTANDTTEKKYEADIGILSTTTAVLGARMLAGTCVTEGDTSCDASTFTNPCEGLGSKVYVTAGSCNFGYACDDVAASAPDTVVEITCSSCNEYHACDGVAFRGDSTSTVTIENSSCNEYYACYYLGGRAGASTSFTISGSCNAGKKACYEVGPRAEEGAQFRFEDSCNAVEDPTDPEVPTNGDYACYQVGYNAGEGAQFTFKNSCNIVDASYTSIRLRSGQDFSCYKVGYDSGDGAQFTFEDSCNAAYSCNIIGYIAGDGTTFEITGGSCSSLKACEELGYEAYDDASFKISNGSCNGAFSCESLGYKVYANSVITVDNGSCNGTLACQRALAYVDGAPATLTIDGGSCNDINACRRIGYEAEGGTFTIDGGSCNGKSACEDIGYNAADATFTITSNSCIDEKACYYMGYDAGAGVGFTVTDGSCIGELACAYLGRYAAENAMFNIASSACIGYKACYYLGAFSSQVSVGEGSCNVTGACTSAKSGDPGSTDPIVIGKNSCNCAGCCTDLQPGSIIGDCQCNNGDCAGKLVNRPEAGVCSTSCASQAGAVPCGFSDDPTVRFTSFCELHDGKHFHNKCRRHQVDDEISLLGPGDAIEKDRIVASCGCCDEEALQGMKEYKNIANDIKEDDAAFCSEPICAPDDSSWEICGGSKKASKKASKGGSDNESDIKIKFCKNGKTECRDPFYKFSAKDKVTCGSCP